MRRWVMQGAIVAWALAATIVAVQASSLARSVKETDKGQTKVQRELAVLEADYAALQEWVAQELRPWAEEVAEVVDEGVAEVPGASPSPSPLPSLAPLPSVTPSPIPIPSPSPTLLPTPSPSLCLPIICEGSASP